MGRNDTPRLIAAFLDSGIGWFLARLVLTFVFWSAGLAHLFGFAHSVAELKTLGLEPAGFLNIVLIVTLLVGSLLILLDRWLRHPERLPGRGHRARPSVLDDAGAGADTALPRRDGAYLADRRPHGLRGRGPVARVEAVASRSQSSSAARRLSLVLRA